MTDQEIALYAALRVRTDPRIRIRTLGSRYHLREDWYELRVETSAFVTGEELALTYAPPPRPHPVVRFLADVQPALEAVARAHRQIGESAMKIRRALGWPA